MHNVVLVLVFMLYSAACAGRVTAPSCTGASASFDFEATGLVGTLSREFVTASGRDSGSAEARGCGSMDAGGSLDTDAAGA